MVSSHLKDLANKISLSWTALLAITFICPVILIGRYFIHYNDSNGASKLHLFLSNQTTSSKFCQNQSKPLGCEALPRGMISSMTDLEMHHLWKFSHPQKKKACNDLPKTLLAMAVGIKHKEIVNHIVKKFSPIDSTVMLFHYDGYVNGWRDLLWIDSALHISATNQSKWWFAKRFLHPDIVAQYDYIFLWDDDLLVDNFNPKRYLSIVEREGLELSQPGLGLSKSEVDHRITLRVQKGDFHRWVEMTAPVFSKAAWRCAWHLIQAARPPFNFPCNA